MDLQAGPNAYNFPAALRPCINKTELKEKVITI